MAPMSSPDTRTVTQQRRITIQHAPTGSGVYQAAYFDTQAAAIKAYHALLVMRDAGMLNCNVLRGEIRVTATWVSVNQERIADAEALALVSEAS